MSSQKGITAISLVMYVLGFLIVTAVIGTITTYFYNNIQIMDLNVSSSAEYNKFNLYMLGETKKMGNTIYAQGDTFITFISSDGYKNTFVKKGNILYYNQIKLCENVNEFKVKVDTAGKVTIKILIDINGKTYTTEYVLN